MKIKCVLENPMYKQNEKRYINIKLDEKTSHVIEKIQSNVKYKLTNDKIQDPLSDSVLRVKIPWRYNRIMCTTDEHFFELSKGAPIEVDIEFCGPWNVGEHSGFTWKVSSIKKFPQGCVLSD